MARFFRSNSWEALERVLAVVVGPALIFNIVWVNERVTLTNVVALLCFLGLAVRSLEGRRRWLQTLWAALAVMAVVGATVQWDRVSRQLPWLGDVVSASVNW